MAKVFVTGLPTSTTEEQLVNDFGNIAPIEKVRLVQKDNKNTGNAFFYIKDEDLEKFTESSGFNYIDQTTNKEYAVDMREAYEKDDIESIFIKNVHFKATPDELRKYLNQYFKVYDITFIKNKEDGRFSGKAFATIKKSGITYVQKLNETKQTLEFKGRLLFIEKSRPKPVPVPPKKVDIIKTAEFDPKAPIGHVTSH